MYKKISKSHFNRRLYDKIYTAFKESFSNTNIESVCEILTKISMYNNERAMFVEDINVKYGILLNYAELEVSEIHHWAETFQISTNPSNQSEPQQSQVPPVPGTEPCSESLCHLLPKLMEQQAEIDRLTYMAEQWSTEEPCRVNEGMTHYNNAGRGRWTCHHSTPNMSPVPWCYHHHWQYDRQGQQRYNHYDWRSQNHSRQEPDQRRYSHTLPNTDNNSASVLLYALGDFSAKQALAQSTLNSIQEFDGSNREATIPWLDQVKLVAERTGIDLLEVGISKLKGLSLGDVNTICKEEGLTWHTFRQCLIEQYSNVPYASDTVFAYTQITQQDDEPTGQYLIRAKVLLEHIHHTSKLSDNSGSGLNNLSLIWGLREHHIRRRVMKEQESWMTMEDVFKSINRITRTEEWMRAYHELKYNSISQVSTEKNHKVSHRNYKTPKTLNKSYNGSHFRSPCNSNQFSRNQGKPQ